MNILDLIQKETGLAFRKKASTRGGEFSGSCPWCGGDDRFSIHPSKNHFVCRQCKKSNDSIGFLKEYRNMDYLSACEYLGIDPAIKFKALDLSKPNKDDDQIKWTPRKIELPPEAWQEKASAILFQKFKFLMSAAGKSYRNWLNARGISNQTIKIARMGYNTCVLSFSGDSWGIGINNSQNTNYESVSEFKQDKNIVNQKKIWLPAGLIIPQFYNQKLVQLRIRQENPINQDRFIMVSGSSMGYFDYDAHINQSITPVKNDNRPWIVTEAGLDGFLIHQEAGDLCRVFAIGNSSARPDIETDKVLSAGPGLLNLDNDAAGQLEQAWWAKHYPSSLTWYSSVAKDPGEDFQAGVNIRDWVKAGLAKLNIQGKTLKPQKNKLEISTLTLKEKTISEHKKRQQNIPKKKLTIDDKKFDNKICLHNLHCASLKDNICLINNRSPFYTLICPSEKWYAHERPGGIITGIVLAPGIKK